MLGLQRRTGYGAIVDMHSGSVGMAIVDLSGDAASKPIFAHREFLKITDVATSLQDTRALRNALLAASEIYTNAGREALRAYDKGGRVTEVQFVYGAPFARTATRFIKVEDSVPFKVSAEQVTSLLAEAEAKDEAEHRHSEELSKLNVVLVERSVIHTAINGYLTPSPYGKEATELSLAHISGLVPAELLTLSAEIEDKIAPHATRHTHTFELALFCVVRDLYPSVAQGLLINISAESTELSVMQDEVLIESAVVPCGAHTFLRQVAADLATMPEEVMMHLREQGTDTPEKTKQAIETATKVYTTLLADALAQLKTKYVLPHTVFLIVNSDLDTFFGSVIEKAMEPYYKAHGAFHALNKTLKDTDGTVASDAFFGIESRFFHKQHGCGEGTL